MCSGRRPSFDSSLIGCVTQLSVIEACVQQGYDSLPAPPTNLELDYVDTHVAVISFEPTRWVQEPGALRYVVQLRTGRTGGFVDVVRLFGFVHSLLSLPRVVLFSMLSL
ncbi:uncharacterized protein LOC106013729 [Aplysia californica]|uniref:Uncharacterized protein LOC106013729 n=1 Tax=Aplysia californica TaxID=6500 RepID=A0ABM1ADN2_APLCA|nr:uncharacterized protein LOC106013729 [Aplysia californica]